ncbi:MAG: WD40 repeat domain-containing protein [Gemmataceae bacterium]
MVIYRSYWACAVVGSACALAAFLQSGGVRCGVVVAAPVLSPAKAPDPPDPTPRRGDLVYAAAYSRDGKLLALAQPKPHVGDGEHRVLVFDTVTWKQTHTLTGPTDHCFGVAFSADGRVLFAACSDGLVYSWETKSGTPGPKLDARAGRCDAVALSPDGTVLVTGHLVLENKEPKRAEVRLWDAATGKSLRTITSGPALLWSSLTFTPDGKALAGCYNNPLTGPDDFSGVVEWDVTTGKERKRYDAVRVTAGAHPISHAVEYTPDGKWLIVGGGEAVPDPKFGGTIGFGYLWLFDRATGRLEKTLVERRHHYIRRLALSPEGDRLFVPTYSEPQLVRENGVIQERSTGELQCWDTRTWELKWAKETDRTYWAVIASPDGRRVGTATSSGFSLRDAKSGDPKGGLIDARRE